MTKITYELDSIEDSGDLKLYQIANDMMMALYRLQTYSRSLYKGYSEFDEDKVLDELNDILYESKIGELE